MITTNDLAGYFARNAQNMAKFCDGLSHDESLLQPHGIEGNCLNWVVGHLVNSRNTILRLTGAPDKQWVSYRSWEALRARYGNGSLPIKADGDDVLKLSQILEGLNATQANITAHFATLSAEQANAEIDFLGRRLPLDHFILYMFGHENYHIGQFEYLRPLSGKPN
jgi:hypothetical protein